MAGSKKLAARRMSLALAVMLAAAVVFTCAPLSQSSPGWTAPENLSPGSTGNRSPQIALDADGHPHAVWYGQDTGPVSRIYYSENTGSGWTTPENISPAPTAQNGYPQIALDSGGNPHVVWFGYDAGSVYRIWYSANTGGTWTTPENISPGTTITNNTNPRIALDSGGNPHVVWYGYDGVSADRIYYSENTGGTWSAPQDLTPATTNNSYGPQIALDSGGNPHVVWYGDESSVSRVYYSENTGSTWTTPENISPGTTTGNSSPQIALDADGHPHVVWHGNDFSVSRVYYSANTGGTWTTPEKLSPGTVPTSNYNPQIALDSGGNPHVVWRGNDNFSVLRVWYSENTESGWTGPLSISPGSITDNDYPQIALDSGGNPHVVWFGVDAGSVWRVWYSANTGSAWSAPQDLTPATTTGNSSPQIALDAGGNPHVVWYGTDATTNRVWYSNYISTYTVNAFVSGGNGNVDPLTQQVAPGDTASINIAPDPGWHIASITDNTVGQPISDPYVINDVTEDHDVQVTFALSDFTWYLPEGSTDGGMSTWVLVMNLNSTDIPVDLVFDTDSGEVALPGLAGLIVPAGSRSSFDVTSYITTYDVSTRVVSHGAPVFCERSTYGADGAWGTSSTGFFGTSDQWCMAEGSTGGGMQTYILVENPNPAPVDVDLKFLTGTGEVQGPTGTIPAHTRATYLANDWVTSYDVATEVTSSGGGVVCERATYGGDQAWGTCSTATPFASGTWYVPGMHTGNSAWILAANPNDTAADIDIKYYTGSGTVQGPQVSLPARSRATFNAADSVTNAYVSAEVTSSGAEVTCDWSEYAPGWTWGISSLAAPFLSTDLFLTEGATDGGMHTFITVFNPGASDVTATLTLYTVEGQVTPTELTDVVIPARNSRGFTLNDYVTDYSVSTRVVASGPVTAKRMTSGPGAVWVTASGDIPRGPI